MNPSAVRTTSALLDEIHNRRDDLIKHFSTIIQLASQNKPDRIAAVNLQLQMQVETSLLISKAERLQELVRTMQECWLYGPLDTMGNSEIKQQTEAEADKVLRLLQQLSEKQQ
ncbi:hypothetical protein B0A48_01792 [Cryoendolithus antarcticus]|uniref:Mediator of RNA polymerase II transcription subunit 22 n=1 Tax=Cryoendolithus antarcticus TaxID=1507870 RepID=A0A1V8TQA0_9PEZI|nr:hypothetical protein B0A48_01792 [Cryoendolithus antarcticus]